MTIKITAIGGGTGQPPVLVGLIKLFHDLDINLSAVVGTWDNGGSSGRLRDLYGVMPPGDILKNIMALTPPENRTLSETLLRRFDRRFPKLYEHNTGNMLMSALEKHMGIIPAIRSLENLLNCQGKVYPVTECDTHLNAEMTRVKSVTVSSEKEIEARLESNYRITKLWLEPEPKKFPCLEALEKADVLIISPGSIFTSILPHFTLREVKDACKKIKTKILIANLVDKHFTTPEYIDSMTIWSGIEPSHIIFNSTKITAPTYESIGYKQLTIEDDDKLNGMNCITRPIIKRNEKLLRHDPKRTAAAIMEVLSKDKII